MKQISCLLILRKICKKCVNVKKRNLFFYLFIAEIGFVLCMINEDKITRKKDKTGSLATDAKKRQRKSKKDKG